MIRLILFFSLLVSHAMAVPDGAWNGHPWDADRLAEGVANGNPEAEAELAYQIMVGWQNETFDEPRLTKYSKKSAESGNAYGQAIYSRVLSSGWGNIDEPELAASFARKASKGGHPLGLRSLANSEFGDNDKRWREVIEEAAGRGCLPRK